MQVAKAMSAKCQIVCSNLPVVFEYRFLGGYKNIFKNYMFVIRTELAMVIDIRITILQWELTRNSELTETYVIYVFEYDLCNLCIQVWAKILQVINKECEIINRVCGMNRENHILLQQAGKILESVREFMSSRIYLVYNSDRNYESVLSLTDNQYYPILNLRKMFILNPRKMLMQGLGNRINGLIMKWLSMDWLWFAEKIMIV